MIKLVHVSKIYKMGGTEVRAMDNVSLKIDDGEFVVIAGVSGSGKSTLLHVLGGLDRPTTGKIIWNKREIL